MKNALLSPDFWSAVGERANKLALMPEASPYGQGEIPTEEALATMSWPDLLALRKKLGNRYDQNAIAPYEHRAYAREFSNTPMEGVQNFLSTLAYTPFKTVVGSSRSDPSFKEMGQGLIGIYEGLRK